MSVKWLSEMMARDNPQFYGFGDWLAWKFGIGWRVLVDISPDPDGDYPGYTVWWHYVSGRRRTVMKRLRKSGRPPHERRTPNAIWPNTTNRWPNPLI